MLEYKRIDILQGIDINKNECIKKSVVFVIIALIRLNFLKLVFSAGEWGGGRGGMNLTALFIFQEELT